MSILQRVNLPSDIKALTDDELTALSSEIREFLIKNVMNTGGHLASNLGVVETTIALLKTFDFPKDKIVFDVGHQCYVYKLLTGRRDRFDTLRHLGGISGFPRTSESEYDFFDVGHAGTAISAAAGMARARDIRGGDENIIALVGDGALGNGMCFEALNDIGHRKTKLIIILNDNEMSIQSSVGGLSSHLTRLRFTSRYIKSKSGVRGILGKLGSAGECTQKLIHKVKDKLKYAAIAAPLFEQLGLTYMGIIDGNDPLEMIKALTIAASNDGPVVIHAFTKKGMGYFDAENDPSKYHGVSSHTSKIAGGISYDEAFSSFVTSLAQNDGRITAITAAMTSGCGLSEFSRRFPDRFFDVGIAEEHAVTMAAGMARGGLVPIVCMYSTFLQRAYDQILHDVCLQKLHVVFAVGHAGITGEDGETHQGLMDMAMLIGMPGMTLLTPSSYDEFKSMLTYAVTSCDGPVAVRYPKASVSFRESEGDLKPVNAELISAGGDILLLSSGRMAETAIKCAKILINHGISTEVVNIRCIVPPDIQFLKERLKGKKLLVTLEDGIVNGGMGQYIAAQISQGTKTLNLGFETPFVPHGKQSELFLLNGLGAEDTAERIQTFYKGMTDKWKDA